MEPSNAPPPPPLFDLTGMDAGAAREYVVSITAHLKQTEADLQTADQEVKRWSERLMLADREGRADLRAEAEARRVEAVDRRTKLELEVWEFRDGVEKLKKQLQLLPLTQRTINPGALLDHLAELAGPLDELGPAAKRAAADDALAALKKRLAGD